MYSIEIQRRLGEDLRDFGEISATKRAKFPLKPGSEQPRNGKFHAATGRETQLAQKVLQLSLAGNVLATDETAAKLAGRIRHFGVRADISALSGPLCGQNVPVRPESTALFGGPNRIRRTESVLSQI